MVQAASEWSQNSEEEFIQESFSIDSKDCILLILKQCIYIYINNPKVTDGNEIDSLAGNKGFRAINFKIKQNGNVAQSD